MNNTFTKNVGHVTKICSESIAIVAMLSITFTGYYLISSTDIIYWINLIYDDAYYYLGIARTIASDGASQFREPITTNGYQPLWLALLTISASVFGIAQKAMALQIFVLIVIFCFAFITLSILQFKRGWPAVLVILLFPGVMLFGMETVMLPAFILLYFRKKNDYLVGVLGSLIFLTRLDALSLIVGRDIYRLVVHKKINFKPWLIIGPIVGLYFFANYFFYGLPIPVSGVAKSIGSIFGENILPALLYSEKLALVIQPLLSLLLIRYLIKACSPLKYSEEISSCLIAIFLCACYYSLLSGWTLWNWYYWPIMVLYFYIIQELFDDIEIYNHKFLYTEKYNIDIIKILPIIFIFLVVLINTKSIFDLIYQNYFYPIRELHNKAPLEIHFIVKILS